MKKNKEEKSPLNGSSENISEKEVLSKETRGRKIFLLTVLFLFVVSITAVIRYFSLFQSSSGLAFKQIVSLAQKGISYQKEYQKKERINFLFLGLDSGPEERLDDSLLTDTIIFLSLNPQDKTITSISVPRDLWFEPLKTKTNSFYYYGEQKKPGHGPEFAQEYLSQILGQPIDFYFVINFSSLKELVDILGGLWVKVERSFTDPRYPLPHPEKIETEDIEDYYEEIHFKAGWQLMDGEHLLKFVRSRNSPDEIEGTDIGRTERQQLVFKSLLSQVLNYKIFYSPQKIGQLYRFFHSKITTNLSDEKLVGLGLLQLPKLSLTMETISLPIGEDEDQKGVVLYHPPVKKDHQWVLEPIGGDFTVLQKFIADELNN